jgi:hypothetical protein
VRPVIERSGSIASFYKCGEHVRFTPEIGVKADIQKPPLRATERMDEQFEALAIEALRQAWPCSR